VSYELFVYIYTYIYVYIYLHTYTIAIKSDRLDCFLDFLRFIYLYSFCLAVWTYLLLRLVSSGMLRRVAFVRTDVSKALSASFIRVTRIGELGTTLAVTSNRRTLRRNTKCCS
jgi:hypothetical protein